MLELREDLQGARESLKAAKGRENALGEKLEGLRRDLQKSQRAESALQGEKEERDQEIQVLRQRVKRLNSGLQVICTQSTCPWRCPTNLPDCDGAGASHLLSPHLG